MELLQYSKKSNYISCAEVIANEGIGRKVQPLEQ